MTKEDLLTIVKHYVPNAQDRDSVLSAVWDYSEALIAAKPIVIRSEPCEDECMWKVEYEHAVKEIGSMEQQLRDADRYIRDLSAQQDYR